MGVPFGYSFKFSQLPTFSRVLLAIEIFIGPVALLLPPFFVWGEYIFFRQQPSAQERRSVIIDIACCVLYAAWFFLALEVW